MNSKSIGISLCAVILALAGCSLNKDGTAKPTASHRPSSDWNQQQPSERPSAGWNQQPENTDAYPESKIASASDFQGPEASPPSGTLREDRVLEPAARPIVPAYPVGMMDKESVSLKTVYFTFDSSSLSAETRKALEGNIRWMRSHPRARIQIEGNCDERGTSAYNLGLGLSRANQVRDYLVTQGIAPHRLTVMSYGEEMPLRYGHDESHWKFNRRVDFRLIEPTAKR